ncbi:MAG: hypothetical protein SOT55_02440 [Candidatus Cryptobacteroides sp.]|nr:hypothetical protein [Candidatus Cryptobacteroides sp.]
MAFTRFSGAILNIESIRSIPTAGEMTGSCISRTDMLTDGFCTLGEPFVAAAGRWIGAKSGRYEF